ncbi:hypothetical protein PSYMO_37711, partial [Pseudomonas amygdali pv. mori str. 301020]
DANWSWRACFEQDEKRLILDLAFDHAVFLDGPLAPM